MCPTSLAHDGFRTPGHFGSKEGYNSLTTMTQTWRSTWRWSKSSSPTRRLIRHHLVVPKKATKAAYHGAFFTPCSVLRTEFVVTLRHPLAACISTYEKSTGLPPDASSRCAAT
jgi:hypothetical protein